MTPAKRLGFKYRSGDDSTILRDISAIRDSAFYAGPRHYLNDPFEGRFDRSNLDAQIDAIKLALTSFHGSAQISFDEVSKSANDLLAFVDKCGIFSLSRNPLNELIWSHYGGSHKGFCIGYDLEKLTHLEPNHFNCIDVAYDDREPLIQSADMFNQISHHKILQKILGTKSTPWRYEEEVRVITTPPGLHKHDFLAIREVYFGLRCPDETQIAVMQALAGRSVRYKQVVSPDSSYILLAEDRPDLSDNLPSKQLYLAPVSEDAIQTANLKSELRQYIRFLGMAAEIVRRDPDCPLVETVSFSSNRGTPMDPVIYVQYQRTPSKWITRYFTLKDINEQHNMLGIPHDM